MRSPRPYARAALVGTIWAVRRRKLIAGVAALVAGLWYFVALAWMLKLARLYPKRAAYAFIAVAVWTAFTAAVNVPSYSICWSQSCRELHQGQTIFARRAAHRIN